MTPWHPRQTHVKLAKKSLFLQQPADKDGNLPTCSGPILCHHSTPVRLGLALILPCTRLPAPCAQTCTKYLLTPYCLFLTSGAETNTPLAPTHDWTFVA